jgi:hypothetical protein
MFIVFLTHLMHNGIQMEDESIVITNGTPATPDGTVCVVDGTLCVVDGMLYRIVMNGTQCTHSEWGSALLIIRTK